MRTFIATVLFLAVATGIAGFAFRWFPFSSPPGAGTADLMGTIASKELPTGHETTFVAIQPKIEDQNGDVPALDGNKERDEFHKEAEIRLAAMALNLNELNAKAKTGHTVIKERLNEAIAELTKKTAAARKELRKLSAASPERWVGLKNRLSISLEQLEGGFERIFSRFMNESAQLTK